MFWIFMLVSYIPSVAQFNYNFKNLSNKEGLSQNSVFSITEDEDGFMWFGTRDGLNKYDGYKFYTYRQDERRNSIVGNDIRALDSDNKTGKLYIGTVEGLSIYDRIKDSFTNYKHSTLDSNSLSHDNIRALYRDNDGRYWIGSLGGLDVFYPETENFIRIKLPGDPLHHSVEVIKSDQSGQILIGTRKGLLRIREEGNIFNVKEFSPLNPLSQTYITSIAIENKDNIWIGTADRGICKWDVNTDQTTWLDTESSNLSNNDVRALCINKKGELWIGTFDGLNLYDFRTHKLITYRRSDSKSGGISDNSIKTIYEDRKGSLWIGTYYRGLNHLDENYNQFLNFTYSKSPNGLSSDIVSSFAEDKSGNIYIGTEGGGLNYYRKRSGNYTIFKPNPNNSNSIAGYNVKHLLLEGDSLWIGTFNQGLDLFIPSKQKFHHFRYDIKNPNSLSNNNVYGLLRNEKNLWIATYGGGLNILDLNSASGTFQKFQNEHQNPNSLSSDFLRVIFKSRSDDIWIGSAKGLNKAILDADGLPSGFLTYLHNEKIYCINEDYRGDLWIGTISNGMYRFVPKTQKVDHFTKTDGLLGNTVFGILEDERNNLWISTNNGISKYDRGSNQFINFDNSSGLQNSEFNFNAYYKTRSGEMLFGGTNGYTRFNPENIKTSNYIPEIVFTALNQNNQTTEVSSEGILEKSLNHTEKLVFNYNEANFSIEFSALDYFSPENNHYQFKLEGVDREWNHVVGNPSATYTLQNSGSYLFKVRGSNSDGVWNPQERQLEIIVLPPPWKSWWAYLLYACLLAGVSIIVFRFFKLRESIKLAKITKEKQEELLDLKMKFYTNITHEFRTPLTLIMGPLEDIIEDLGNKSQYHLKNRLEKIYSHSERMLNLVNQLMTFRKIEAGHEPLKVQKVNLKSFVEKLFNNFVELSEEHKIHYTLHHPEKEIYLWIDKEKMQKVILNLLANAFKFTDDEGRIELLVEEKDHTIEISVNDDGIGIPPDLHEHVFQRFYEKTIQKKNSLIKGSGIGLSLSRQLVELHSGKIRVESQLNEGAKFSINLLKGYNHFNETDFATEAEIQEMQSFMDNQLPVLKVQPDDNQIKHKPTLITNPNIKILIVDDNAEILDYIHSIFAEDYRIITALDGMEGLNKVKNHQPDLIITDLMMPNMDGIEFCKQVRSDFEISHIPILMVTAKTFEEDRLGGLKIGANDYITKPFHSNELKFKVYNILEQRRKLVDIVQKNTGFSASDVNVTSADEEFLANLVRLVEENISNPDFNIEKFSCELAVSRSLLFSKMKALTNSTPKNFVKSYRLKRAVQLLETKKLSISEVAYKVGFNDPKYFSKVFAKEFSVPPSVYLVENSYN